MSGCPYVKYNFKKNYEECKLTKENVEGFIMCDFEFEDCPDYQKAQADKAQGKAKKSD